MRSISKGHRNHHRAKAPRIAISQAEITADLLYPASQHATVDVRSGRTRRRVR